MDMEERLEKAYFEYDPDQDFNGEKGLTIAEAVFRRCGYDFNKLRKWVMMHRISHLSKTYSVDNQNNH